MDRRREENIIKRLDLSIFPVAALIAGTVGLTEGGINYGFNNYTIKGGTLTEHVDGLLRHLFRYIGGEEYDEHGVHNLFLAQARLAIILDLRERKLLIDDRPPKLPVSRMIDQQRALIGRLLEEAHDKPLLRYTQMQPNPEEDLDGETEERG